MNSLNNRMEIIRIGHLERTYGLPDLLAEEDIVVQNLLITTTPLELSVMFANHIIFANKGLNDLLYSKTNSTGSESFLDAGESITMDFVKMRNFVLRTAAGTTTLRLIAW